MPQKTDAVIAELMDRRLLNDVDPDLHQEIAKAVVKAVHTASIEGDAVERVASYLASTDAFHLHYRGFAERNEAAKFHANAILATGLVPDEAAVRAAHIEVLRGLEPKMADAVNWKGPEKTKGEHLFHMVSVIENSLDMPIDKIARWTGFIQGVLAARGLLDVDAERDRTRPIFAVARQLVDEVNQAKP